MNDKEEHIDLAKEAPLLAALNKEHAFLVPNQYFETLTTQINHQINIEVCVSEANGLEIPKGYFEDLTSNLLSKIALEEKLEGIKSKPEGFIIPENYFLKAKAEIIKATGFKKAKTKIFNLSFVRFAAAACILITCSLGFYFNIQHSNNINDQLSKVSNEEIETYLSQNTDISEVSLIVENLDQEAVFTLDNPEITKEEINSYLESTY